MSFVVRWFALCLELPSGSAAYEPRLRREWMDPGDAIHLLDQLGVLSHPCDLDLLLFFAKHPRCLLSSEALAAFLGYEPKVMADSLDTLLAAGLLARTQTPAHAARLYVLTAGSSTDETLRAVLAAAATRAGRLALREALAVRAGQARDTSLRGQSSRPGPRRIDARGADDDRSHTG